MKIFLPLLFLLLSSFGASADESTEVYATHSIDFHRLLQVEEAVERLEGLGVVVMDSSAAHFRLIVSMSIPVAKQVLGLDWVDQISEIDEPEMDEDFEAAEVEIKKPQGTKTSARQKRDQRLASVKAAKKAAEEQLAAVKVMEDAVKSELVAERERKRLQRARRAEERAARQQDQKNRIAREEAAREELLAKLKAANERFNQDRAKLNALRQKALDERTEEEKELAEKAAQAKAAREKIDAEIKAEKVRRAQHREAVELFRKKSGEERKARKARKTSTRYLRARTIQHQPKVDSPGIASSEPIPLKNLNEVTEKKTPETLKEDHKKEIQEKRAFIEKAKQRTREKTLAANGPRVYILDVSRQIEMKDLAEKLDLLDVRAWRSLKDDKKNHRTFEVAAELTEEIAQDVRGLDAIVGIRVASSGDTTRLEEGVDSATNADSTPMVRATFRTVREFLTGLSFVRENIPTVAQVNRGRRFFTFTENGVQIQERLSHFYGAKITGSKRPKCSGALDERLSD